MNEELICAECGEVYFLDTEGIVHHGTEKEIDYDADADHTPYGANDSGNTIPCPHCGAERTCDEDGLLAVGEACPLCGYIDIDQDSIRDEPESYLSSSY